MGAIITLLAVVTMSLLVNRIATVALVHTGVSKDLARFHARSAFTGCGFSSQENETMMQHPVRRRIIMILMFAGSVGFVTIIATGITGFVVFDTSRGGDWHDGPIAIEFHDTQGNVFSGTIHPSTDPEHVANGSSAWYSGLLGLSPNHEIVARFVVLALGLIVLYLIAISDWVDRILFRVIGWALRRFTAIDTLDYQGLLHLGEGYVVVELMADADDWITGKSLAELRLADEGVQVLGIHRTDGTFIGAPRGNTFIGIGDRLSVWGQTEHIRELDTRRATREGEIQHEQRVREQQEMVRQESERPASPSHQA